MADIGGATGGQMLGVARGSIEISTADLRKVSGETRTVADQTTTNLGKIDGAVKRTEGNFARLGRGLGSIRGELSGIAVGAGLINGLGLSVAAGFEEADIKLSGMTGGLANAQKLTAELRKQAFAAGLPFQDMLNMATRLLPTLGGNTKELQNWYDIVKRTAVLNAQEGVSGAAFSINEALSSGGTDLVSLVERFNISRVKLREALAANGGDFRKALDQVLTSMGITSEVADRMGQTFNASFRVAKDAALQFLAEGFTPLLQMYTPLLQQGAAWLAQMRESNPAVAQLGAGLATAAAVGAPALLLLNQLIEAGQKLKALGVLGTLGRGGVLVGAAVGGGIAGLELGRTVGRATGNESMANATWASVGKSVEQLGFIVTKFAVDFTAALKYAGATVEKAMLNLAASILNVTAAFMRRIAEMLPAGGGTLNKTANGLDVMASAARQLGQMRVAAVDREVETGRQNLLAWAQRIQGTAGAGTASTAGNERAQALAATNAERDKAIREWAKAAADIEREAGQARIDATRQYEQQRAQTIADYERGITRDAEDFARQRARQAAQLERDIAAIRADAVSRETKWAADLADATAAIQTDGNKRLIKLESDYNRDREQAARDHRDRLLSAAARLDAVAVYEEKKRYATQSADAQTAYNERTQAERQNMAERIAEENKGHAERLQAAREADAQRIAEMRQSTAEAQALEDEDRALRLQRQAEDHQRQLEQMATAQADRLAQIDTQAARERQALNDNFTQQLNDLGTYQQAWRDMQAEQQQASLDQFGKFWEAFQKQFPDPVQGPRTNPQGSAWPEHFADGGWVRRTGRATVHAGEYVLTAAQAQAMAGGRAAAGGSAVNFEAINVYAAPGQSPEAIGREVTRQIVAMLETVQ